ncbi:hypothetical protein VTN02DRAFT_4330 [Thermoascus thermophilus]
MQADAAFCASCWTAPASSTTSSMREDARCRGMTVRRASVQRRLSRPTRDLVCFWSGWSDSSQTSLASHALLSVQVSHTRSCIDSILSGGVSRQVELFFSGGWIVQGEVGYRTEDASQQPSGPLSTGHWKTRDGSMERLIGCDTSSLSPSWQAAQACEQTVAPYELLTIRRIRNHDGRGTPTSKNFGRSRSTRHNAADRF